MGKFVKRQNAIGWDWYLETDEESSWVSHMVKEYIERLEAENAKLREYLAVSIPLPLDGNRSAIHPDDIIGNNVNGTDFFGIVTEMYLTRYPRDGQPALWVVRTEDGDGKVIPRVCWGGRCNAVHKQASQTYSAEYLETYDENKQLKAENAKLREVVDIFIHCIGDLHSCYTCQVKGNPYDFQHDWGACDELRDMLVDMGFEVPDAENA